MKTKNKLIAMLEIAIVLCSLFLVATLPAIAAEQNRAMQEVSANTITTASENDYVLGVYGNANEDDTIDMRDLTYVKLIFFGKKPETELADAKYDGKINPLDFIQIKLIIVGKEKELTIVDSAGREVTVKKPIERIVSSNGYVPDSIRLFGALDKLVGVSSSIDEALFPELSEVPRVGRSYRPDYEAVLSLNPDLVITMAYKSAEHAEKMPGIPLVGLNLYACEYKSAYLVDELTKLGYILNKKDETEHYLDDFHDKYMDLIQTRTEELAEEERPKTCMEYNSDYKVSGGDSSVHYMLDVAGGRNIFAHLKGKSWFVVDPEVVIERNPDIIIRQSSGAGYGVDDISEMKALRESIMNRPELARVSAVKNGKVYIIYTHLSWGLDYPISTVYWAKWCHPELFKDLDPHAIHQEYLAEFQGLDYDLDKHGVFVYPEEPV